MDSTDECSEGPGIGAMSKSYDEHLQGAFHRLTPQVGGQAGGSRHGTFDLVPTRDPQGYFVGLAIGETSGGKSVTLGLLHDEEETFTGLQSVHSALGSILECLVIESRALVRLQQLAH